MQSNSSRRRLIAAAVLMASGLSTTLALALAFPDKSKPIRVIAPYGPGTSTDVLARAVARGMTEISGANVVIDNRVGADGIIAMQAAKAAAPDGYTVVFTSLSTQVVNPHTFKQLPYDAFADFIPLAGLGTTPLMMNLGPSAPFKTAREFIAAAKAEPGKYTFGSGTTTTRLVGEILQKSAGIQLLNIPYKALTDTMTNLAGGQIHLVLVDPGTAAPFYKLGVRPVATTAAKRVSQFPEVPTLQEEGLAGFEAVGWIAAYYPAKTPPAIVAAMQELISSATKTRYVTDVYKTFAMEPLPLVGDQLDKFQREESKKWGAAVRAAGLEGKL